MEQLKKEYASIERSPVIDPELRDLLPPITDEERAALTADILKNGCYSPMICMEDMTLVDGHHRYDICAAHDIPYRMVILDFEDKLAAKEWMVNAQKGRRNLTAYQLGQIALKLKPEIEARARKNQSDAGGNKKSLELNPLSVNSPKALTDGIDTRKKLAAVVGIGEQAMGRIIQIDESAPAPIKEALQKDVVSVNKAYGMTKKLKALPEEQREDAAKELLRQDELKEYRQIDEDAAIAKAINSIIHQAGKLEATERGVRLWADLCCIEDIALRRELQLARIAAENLKNISLHIETIMEERSVAPYEEQPDAASGGQ